MQMSNVIYEFPTPVRVEQAKKEALAHGMTVIADVSSTPSTVTWLGHDEPDLETLDELMARHGGRRTWP